MESSIQQIKRIHWGSFKRRALIIAAFLIAVVCAQAAVRDTLILDGMVIRIDEEVEVDTVWVDPGGNEDPVERPGRITEPGDGWSIGLSVGPKICRYKAVSIMPGMSTLESFVENGVKAVVGFSAGAVFRYDLKGPVSLSSGIELSMHGWNGNYFDPATMNDSLFAFVSPGSGELDQILRFRYQGLGTEFDTLGTEISTGKFRMMSVDIPLMINYEFPVKELGRFQHLEAGVGIVNRVQVTTSAEEAVVLNGNGEWRLLEGDDFDPSSYWLLGRAQLSWSISNKVRKQFWGASLYFQTPVTAINVSPETLDIQGLESGLSIFFRFFLN